ncbi:hypothetical protein ACFWIX_13120 [Pseudarthrobacter sp. NPDC058362]|uniref:hypothetical protein n=1 Tax=Pseudarthrobacter sp. NPDC058362 TaxID=3346458 RepID=UPI00365893E2
MTAVSKWVAAGASAAVVAGGLFLGAPAASAAPGDAACLQASTQFEAALSAAGITEETVTRLEAAAEAAAVAEAKYFELVEAAGADLDAQLGAAEAELEAATTAVADAEAALAAAQEAGDADAIAEAEAARDAAVLAENEAGQKVDDLNAAYEAAISTPEILAAEDAYEAALAEFETALGAVSLDEETAANLLALFKAFLAACNPDAIGADTPAAAPAAAPVVNKGLNVQTAVETEPATHPGLALLAGLLAAGIAVPAGVALRMRRLESARK